MIHRDALSRQYRTETDKFHRDADKLIRDADKLKDRMEEIGNLHQQLMELPLTSLDQQMLRHFQLKKRLFPDSVKTLEV